MAMNRISQRVEGKVRALLSTERDTLSGLKLLVALDAMLVEGSIGRAAERLDVNASAMSRMLAQIREWFGDPIFIRTGRGMVPTPFAESLRSRLRTLSSEAEDLLAASPGAEGQENPPEQPAYKLSPRSVASTAPLPRRRQHVIEGGPSPEVFSRRLDDLAQSNDPLKRLAKHIATVGAGAGRTRPLTLDEADEAMSIILAGDADAIQIGALFVALQYRGATPAELAGLAQAVRRHAGAYPYGSDKAVLDWPVYLSPRRGTAPWFLLAAKLVSASGRRVMVHGLALPDTPFEGALAALSIPTVGSLDEAAAELKQQNIAFLPLDRLSPQLHALLGLYQLFQMRSPLNRMVHLLNPLGAGASLLGSMGGASAEILRDAAKLAGSRNLTILSTSRDTAQATPFRAMPLLSLVDGDTKEFVIPSVQKPKAERTTGLSVLEYLEAVWNGTARDDGAVEIILATTTAALFAHSAGSRSWDDARKEAQQLWSTRR
jgi:anthranilate phosphoribosyltransferase